MKSFILSLKKDATELPSLLWDGWWMSDGKKWRAIPREGVYQAGRLQSIIFEVTSPEHLPRWFSRVWLAGFLKSVCSERLRLTFLPGICVMLYGWAQGWETHWVAGLCGLLGALFLQVGLNLLSDVEDHLRLAALSSSVFAGGLIQRGWLSARQIRSLGLGCLFFGAALGLPALIHQPQIVLALGTLAMVGIFAFSSRPWGFKYKVWSEIVVFALAGPLLTLGVSLAAFDTFDQRVLGLGAFFGFMACTISHVGHLVEMEIDRTLDLRTLCLMLGFEKARHLLMGFYGLAILCLAWMLSSMELGLTQALVLCPWGFVLLRLMRSLTSELYQVSGPCSALVENLRSKSMRVYWAFALGLWVCLILYSFVRQSA